MSKCGNVKKVFVPSDEKIKENISNVQEAIATFSSTKTAIKKIKEFIKKDNKTLATHGLKIKVVRDGCSGNSYDMSLTSISDANANGDKTFIFDNVTIMVEKLSYMFVIGSQLDYVETLLMSGFQISNPNVKKECSCGSSFSIK